MELLEALKTYFGYDSFRPGQEAVVSALCSGRDVAAVMPTGAGKSLCFQLPALLLEGITLVVSPLISLMRDQVAALVQAGIPAAFFNSALTERQYALALERARAGRYKLIYVAPERLGTERFLDFALHAEIALLAVDEAHCVSQWGQDFRPHYLEIPDFAARLPRRPVVGAFTATATQAVRRDMRELLQLRDPYEIVTGFDRPNLFFAVRHGREQDKRAWLLEFVKRHGEDSGIVYCATRKKVEEVCALLKAEGVPAGRYHAGLEQEERGRSQEDFLWDRIRVMVATNAFGMGIDKSDVRYVVHYNMPKDMESYYQEAGRAGRDGEKAECVLLYSSADEQTARFLIQQDRENEALDEAQLEQVRRRDYARLRRMSGYCHTGECLRRYLLEYFGETPPGRCGSCGNCLEQQEAVDVTAQAAAILRCVARLGPRFGMSTICDLVRGADSRKLRQWGLNHQEGYGVLKGESREHVNDCIRALIAQGCLVRSEGEYPVLGLGEAARWVLEGDSCVTMRASGSSGEARRTGRPSGVAPENEALFGRLRAVRAALARRLGLPAYVVFSDAALRDMCAKRPQTERELLNVSGVGEAKLQRYGAAFLEELRKA